MTLKASTRQVSLALCASMGARHIQPVAGQTCKLTMQERQDLIQQWEEAVAQMRRTDAAIQTASEWFADGKLSLREKQRRLDIAAQFLDDQFANNKDCEGQIETLERDLARLRTEFNSRQVCSQRPKFLWIHLTNYLSGF